MKLSKKIGIYIISFIFLGICILASLAWGSRYIDFREVIHALTDSSDMSFNALVVRERIPRTYLVLLQGLVLEFQEHLCSQLLVILLRILVF